MATLLSIDESPSNQGTTNDLTLPATGDVVTALNSYFGNSTWTSTVKQAAKKTGVLSGLTKTKDLALTTSTGTNLNGADSGLNDLLGNDILLYTDTTNNNLVIGKVGTTVMFVLYLDATGSSAGSDLDATGADLWMVEFQPIQHNLDGASANDFVSIHDAIWLTITNPLNFSLSGAPSGQNLFLMFSDGQPGVDENGNPDTDEVAIVVTAPNAGGTVNTGQGGGGTTIGNFNQMVDPAEALLFSFVQGANPNFTVPNLTAEEAGKEENIDFNKFFETNSASFTVVQLQPTKLATMTISAFKANLNTQGDQDPSNDTVYDQLLYLDHQLDNVATNIDNVTITRSVTVKKVTTVYTVTYDEDSLASPVGTKKVGSAQATAMTAAEITALGLTVTFPGNDVKVKGVISGDNFLYVTDTQHDRVIITNTGDATDANYNSAFDIGAFRIESAGLTTNLLDPIDVYDDGPNISAAPNTTTVTHDETPGVDSGTDSAGMAEVVVAGATIASLFAGVTGGDDPDVADNPIGYARSGGALITVTGDAGTDGPATQELTYGIQTVTGRYSGVSTSEGTQIFMYNGPGGLVFGRVGTEGGATDSANPNGDIAFALAVNPLNGEVFVAQYLSLAHLTGGAPSYDESIALNADAVQQTATRRDRDNDSITDSDNNVGAQIKFEDDGPNIVAAASAATVTHDETPGVDSTDVLGSALIAVGGAQIATLFTGFTAGDDPDVTDNPIGYVRSGSSMLTISVNNPGADGPAAQTPTYAISTTNSTPSGVSTSEGTQIFMYNGPNGLVFGRVGNELAGGDSANASGAIAFALAVNPANGELFVAQYLSLSHPTGGASSYDESIALNANALQMSVTLTDKDGDTNTDSGNDVGNHVNFEDDGPNIVAAVSATTVTHDETPGVDAGTDVAGTALVAAGGAQIATLFAGVTGGDDPDVADNPIGYARSGSSMLTISVNNPGADGPAAQSLNYAISANDGTFSGVSTSEGTKIFMYNGPGSLVFGRVGNELAGGDTAKSDGAIAFALAVNPANGELFVAQYLSLLHPTGGASSFDESIPLDAAALQMSVTLTDKDGDTHTDSGNNIGDHVNFQDDGPGATAAVITATVDDDGAPLNTGNAGGTGDVEAGSAAGGGVTDVITGVFNAGADGVKTYQLNSVTSGLPSSLTSQGGAVVYNVNGNMLTAYVEVTGAGYNAADDREVFTFSLSGTNNSIYTFTLLDQLDHAAPPAGTSDENNLVLNLGTALQVVDKDDDVATATAAQLAITVNDDSPVINSFRNIVYANGLNGSTGGTGTFDYSIGTDDRDTANYVTSSDLLVSLTGSVGASALTDVVVSRASETDATAVFNFSFKYVSDPIAGTTTPNTGTITFDKANDSYAVTLAQPISSYAVLSLADPNAGFQGYVYNSTTTMGGLAGVTTAKLANSFYVQFTGFAEPSGNGTDSGTTLAGNANLDALVLNATWAHNDDDNFTAGELFTVLVPKPGDPGAQMVNPSTVSISGSSAGTNSDTMQSGEVLDFTLYSGDPQGLLSPANATKTTVGTIFIEFDQLGWDSSKNSGEDMVIVLKLVSASNPNLTTTRAIIVQAADIYHAGDTLPTGFGFTQPLTGNNGMVIIESNDYNFGGENWTIQGAQVLASTEGVLTAANTAVDLKKAAAGASTLTAAFSASADAGNVSAGTWDSDVFKIVNIGFVTNNNQDGVLNFSVKAVDYDGDTTAAQNLGVAIVSGNTFTGTASPDSFVMTDISTDVDLALTAASRTVMSFNATQDVLDFATAGTAANTTNGMAFGTLAAFIAAADTGLDGTHKYYFGTVGGTDTYLAYDDDGNGFTAIIKLVGVTANFDHNDIV